MFFLYENVRGIWKPFDNTPNHKEVVRARRKMAEQGIQVLCETVRMGKPIQYTISDGKVSTGGYVGVHELLAHPHVISPWTTITTESPLKQLLYRVLALFGWYIII